MPAAVSPPYPVVGVVGTGQMGSALGRALAQGGCRVLVALDGRSSRSRSLAAAGQLTDVGGLNALVASASVVLSVVPPAAATAAARDVAAAARETGAAPLVADLNAVAPETVADVLAVLRAARCDVVDGSISAGPPTDTRDPALVYLSGPRAAEVAALPAPAVQWRVLGSEVGTASALKMCTASMYKGFSALALQAMVTAHRYGVLDEFVADIAREWPASASALHVRVALAATKADRFVGEMREIARTQAGAGLPAELFTGMAQVWEAVATTPLAAERPETLDRSMDAATVLSLLQPDSPDD